MPNATAEERPAIDAALRPGELVDGKYRVDYVVGEGGMATVWAATNERTGKRVALKMLLHSIATLPAAKELFRREGLAASRIDHPNVVTIFDVVEHHRTACIVMELLAGEPLDRYLELAGKLTVEGAYGLLLPAMWGVAAAHAQGVIHRDLKPQNIFICMGPDRRPVTTKVLDFGISLIVERVLDNTAGPLAEIPLGTPAYMAPEQIMASETIDERADVYGFGVLLFEALTGQVPFLGEPGAELWGAILNQPAPSLAQVRPDVPPGIARAVDMALAKDPAARHQTMEAMIAALEQEMLLASSPARFPTRAGLTAFDLTAQAGRAGMVSIPAEPSAAEHQSTQFLLSFPFDPKPSAQRRPSQTHEASTSSAPGGRLGSRASGLVLRSPARGRFPLGMAVAALAVGIGMLTWSPSARFEPESPRPAVIQRAPMAQPLAPPPSPASQPLVPAEAAGEAVPPPRPAATAASDEPTAARKRRSHRRIASPTAGISKIALREQATEARASWLPSRTHPAAFSPLVPPPMKAPPLPGPARRRAGPLSAADF